MAENTRDALQNRMIATEDEFQRTRQYVESLQQILLDLRRTHAPAQYDSLSRGFVKELAQAQRDITAFLSAPAPQKPS